MRLILLVTLLPLLGAGPASKATSRPSTLKTLHLKDDAPDEVRDWFKRQPELKKKELIELRKRIAAVESEDSRTRAQIGGTEAGRNLLQEHKEYLTSWKKWMRRIENDALYVSMPRIYAFEPGDYGVVGEHVFTGVIRVADSQSLVIAMWKLFEDADAARLAYLTGFSTAGITDDTKMVEINYPIYVRGTGPRLGKTMFLVEYFPCYEFLEVVNEDGSKEKFEPTPTPRTEIRLKPRDKYQELKPTDLADRKKQIGVIKKSSP